MMEPPILVFLIYLSILTVSKLFLVCMTVDQGEIHFVNTVWKQITSVPPLDILWFKHEISKFGVYHNSKITHHNGT